MGVTSGAFRVPPDRVRQLSFREGVDEDAQALTVETDVPASGPGKSVYICSSCTHVGILSSACNHDGIHDVISLHYETISVYPTCVFQFSTFQRNSFNTQTRTEHGPV